MEQTEDKEELNAFQEVISGIFVKLIEGIMLAVPVGIVLFAIFILVKFIRWAWYANV